MPADARSLRLQVAKPLCAASLVCLGLFVFGAYRNGSLAYNYLPWNLLLAWLPFLFAFWLVRALRHKLWSSWEALGASFLWLLFLPNSFYLISDLIHLQEVPASDVLYDTVLFTAFVFTGTMLGISSLFMVHRELLKRQTRRGAAFVVGLVLLLCSFAIYIGRDLRWNSWDVFTDPAGLLFDVSDRLLHPRAYSELLLVVISFFVLLSTLYAVVLRLTKAARRLP